MGFKVVNTFPFPGVDFREDLVKPLGAVVITKMCRTEDEIIEVAHDADAVIGAATFQPFVLRVFEALPKCRIVASSGIGFERADLDAATQCTVVFTNTPDYGLDEVSGRALAFMLALGHRLFFLDKGVKEKGANYLLNQPARKEIADPIFRMRDQTLGIVGFGRIGTALGLKVRGLGMRVITYDPYVQSGVVESRGAKPVDFDVLLKESDFISVHTPLTPETTHMFGYNEFRKMKRNCYFINTARGGCVEQSGLIRALQEKLIAGVGLDVTEDEPLAPDNPLLAMPNVILTGHSAGYSRTAEPELFMKPMTQVVKALKGEWPPYAVNPEVQRKWLQKWGKQR